MATRLERAAVLRAVRELCAMEGAETRRRASLDARFVKFSTDFPQLFEMVAKEGPEFDVSHLAFMMAQLDAVDVGDRSLDDAQKLLFTRLNGEFVDPLTESAAATRR